MPAAHALMQAREDLEHAVAGIDGERLWVRPGGAAAVGFHLRHVAGSIDRLLAYSRGEQLTAAQIAALEAEQRPGANDDTTALLTSAQRAIDQALDVLRRTPVDRLLEPREVGRGRLPSTVLGVLFHIAEHTQRHVGQTIATAKVVQAMGAAPTATPADSGTRHRP